MSDTSEKSYQKLLDGAVEYQTAAESLLALIKERDEAGVTMTKTEISMATQVSIASALIAANYIALAREVYR